MAAVTVACLTGLIVAAALFLVRVLRGPTLADRLVALDALVVTLVSGIGVQAASTGRGTFVDVLVVASLVGFVGTITVTRFIERGQR